MALNLISPTTFTTAVLIGDTVRYNGTFETIPSLTQPGSTALEIQATDAALLVSRLTTSQRDAMANPVNGMIIYNLTTQGFNVYQNNGWYALTSGSGGSGNVAFEGTIGSAVAGDIAVFADTSGLLVKDSTVPLGRGNNNIAVGNALAAITTGNNNAALGFNALAATTTGNQNVALGNGALASNTTVNNLTAVGYQALNANTTGTQNVAVGRNALLRNTAGSSNTALGFNALEFNTTGQGNVAVGSGTLAEENNVSSSNTTAIGFQAGQGHSKYTSCTFLGQKADAAVTELTNACALGANALVGVDNALVLGNRCNVGIGTNSPAYALHLGVTTGATPPAVDIIPLIYLTSIPGTPPAAPTTAEDGILYVNTGQPQFTSGTPTYTGAVVTASASLTPPIFDPSAPVTPPSNLAATSGIATLRTSGLIAAAIIMTTAVKANSIVLVTRNEGHSPNPPHQAATFRSYSVGEFIPGESFQIAGESAADGDDVNWLIINPTYT